MKYIIQTTYTNFETGDTTEGSIPTKFKNGSTYNKIIMDAVQFHPCGNTVIEVWQQTPHIKISSITITKKL